MTLRWPFRTKHREQIEALERDKQERARVAAQWPIVRQVVAAMREHHERNHFSESLSHIYRGGRA